MSPFLPFLFVISAAATDPADAGQARVIEILIAGPESGRSKMEESIRPLLGDAADLRWSTRDSIPVEEAMPAATSAGSTRIWIDLANPVQLRVYLPAQTAAGATTIRTVERPEGQDADLVVRETVAQIVKAAVQGLRGGGPMPPAETEPETRKPAPAAASSPDAVMVAAPPSTEGQGKRRPGRFGIVLAGGAHTSPFHLGEPAPDKNWLGPAVVGQIRWHLDKYLLAFRMAWEASDRSVDAYYLKNTYLTGTVAGSRFFESGVASFGIGCEAGVLVLHQNTWLDGEWYGTNGFSRASSLPGQTGQTNSTGALFGPVVEFNLAPTPHLFLHLGASIPFAFLRTKDDFGTRWEGSPYFRATVGVGFRL